MVKIAFFDTKNYDKEVFNKYNKEYKYDITYFESKLNSETAPLTKGFDVVCIFDDSGLYTGSFAVRIRLL